MYSAYQNLLLLHCSNQAEFVEAQAAIKFALKVTAASRVAALELAVIVSGANKRSAFSTGDAQECAARATGPSMTSFCVVSISFGVASM